ncbi:hypothetical protein GCM10027020_00880 [Nocardioides salsibiostraticola]
MAPLIVYIVAAVLVLLLLIPALVAGRTRQRVALGSALLISIILPVVLSLPTSAERGVIWQGRYGLPYSVGFVLLSSVILLRSRRRYPSWRFVILCLGVYGVAMGAAYLRVRDNELLDDSASTPNPIWFVPSTTLIILVILLAMAAFAHSLSRRTDDVAV